MAKRLLTCCVCSAVAGRFEQHWNRDTGWGVCRACVDWQIDRKTPAEEIADLYGKPGINYEGAPDEVHPDH